jgi:hypothetical protein
VSHQIGFYTIDDDETALCQRAEEVGLVAIPEYVPTDTTPKPTPPTKLAADKGARGWYLLPDTLAPVEAFYREVPSDPGQSRIMGQASPVIQFLRSPCDGRCVYNGRLYLATAHDDPRYPAVKKTYDQLVRFVRKWTRTDRFGFYVGPRTAEMARRGEIRLMHHQIELIVADSPPARTRAR